MLNACKFQATVGVPVTLILVLMVAVLQSQSEIRPQLSFNFNEFYFGEEGATISWNVAGPCYGTVSYRVLRLLGNVGTQLTTTEQTMYVISDDHLRNGQGNPPKFYVEAYCNAGLLERSNYSLVIPSQVYTTKKYIDSNMDFCLKPGDFTLSVIMPTNTSAEESCICKTWLEINECNFVRKGKCGEVYSNHSHICWHNISDGSIIHFVREHNPSNLINFPQVNLEFNSSYAKYEIRPQLSFNFNEFYFREEGATISWNVAGPCYRTVSYRVLKLLGNVGTQLATTDKTTYLISDEHLRNDQENSPRFNVEAYCNASLFVRSNYSLVIRSQVYTTKKYIDSNMDFCLKPGDFTLSVIMPTNTSAKKSCICKTWLEINECNFVREGKCGEVYSNRSHICWHNILDGSVVHFVREQANPSNFPQVNLEFNSSYAIYDSPPQFTFWFSEFYLEKNGVTISWNAAGPCDERVSYHVMRAFNNVTSTISSTNETKFKITRYQVEELSDQPKFYVDAYCNDNLIMRSDFSLIFPREVHTMTKWTNLTRELCLQPNNDNLSVIMPRTISVNESCICDCWFRIDRCKFVREGLCNRVNNIGTILPETKLICWQNISNGTKIHFVDKAINAYDKMDRLLNQGSCNRVNYIETVLPETKLMCWQNISNGTKIHFDDKAINAYDRLLNPVYSLKFVLSYQIFIHASEDDKTPMIVWPFVLLGVLLGVLLVIFIVIVVIIVFYHLHYKRRNTQNQ